MGNKAVLVIDMLNDFLNSEVNPKVTSPLGAKIIPNVKRLAEQALKTGALLVYCCDTHRKTDAEMPLWGEHAMEGTKGSEIIPQLPTKDLKEVKRGSRLDERLLNGPGPFRVDKHSYDAFYDTHLDALLKLHGIDTVYIVGLTTGFCVRHTTNGAFERGYNVIVVKDAIEGFTEEENVSGMKDICSSYKVKVSTVKEALSELVK